MRLAAEKIDFVEADHFVVGSGCSLTLLDAFSRIAEAVEKLIGFRVEVKHLPWPPSTLEIERRSLRLDPSRFCRRTGWAPEHSFEEGVAEAARRFAQEEGWGE
jgi:nucleoside-diphosphate-sugar epimerase